MLDPLGRFLLALPVSLVESWSPERRRQDTQGSRRLR